LARCKFTNFFYFDIEVSSSLLSLFSSSVAFPFLEFFLFKKIGIDTINL
jgi:hypothetical protein